MKTIAWWLATFAVFGMLGTARAESGEVTAAPPSQLAPDALFIKTGLAKQATAVSLGVGWDCTSGICSSFPEALSLTFDLELGHWQTFRLSHGETAEFTQFGLTPMLRYSLADSGSIEWFAEGGAGFHFIVPLYRNQEKRFGTNFNFQDLIGFGIRYGEKRRNEVVLYVSHFSNGNLKQPNPGEDFLQLRYLRHFD